MFQFKQISPNIQKSLFKRIDALNRENEMKPLEPRALDNSKHMDEMFTKSCWAKVTSAVPELDNDGKKVGNKLFRISSPFLVEVQNRCDIFVMQWRILSSYVPPLVISPASRCKQGISA